MKTAIHGLLYIVSFYMIELFSFIFITGVYLYVNTFYLSSVYQLSGLIMYLMILLVILIKAISFTSKLKEGYLIGHPMTPSAEWTSEETHYTHLSESAAYSFTINQSLWESDKEIVMNQEMYSQIKRYMKKHKNTLIPIFIWQWIKAMQNKQPFFNDKKLCMSQPLSNSDLSRCHIGGYYDTFLTNRIFNKSLKCKHTHYHANEIFHCKPKLMNNQIGVSTIGFTLDGYLLLWQQNSKALSSSGLLAPTGSGSLDYSMMKKNSLNKTLINAMNTELWEESNGKETQFTIDDIGRTYVIGHYRWMTRGGQPQFAGVSFLNIDYKELSPNLYEVTHGESKKIHSIEELIAHLHLLLEKDNLSFPLRMNILFLLDYIQEYPDFVSRMLIGAERVV
ncbi:hypothetical protein [Rossellomorea sp. NS-SX7]|uniref:hypothetical protein n=1 Tax=Rossellomorea sp. NS-SX7 TaxID=3463856 RepID=UPI00405803A1